MAWRSTFVIAAALVSASPSWATANTSKFSRQVTRICLGARLFAGEHEIGTRAGAIAVSRDIRRTGRRRLRRVAAIVEPKRQAPMIRRWLRVEQLLVDLYAGDYLRIWEATEAANTPSQRAALPGRLNALIHQPDNLKRRADTYELWLVLPDCTGGGS